MEIVINKIPINLSNAVKPFLPKNLLKIELDNSNDEAKIQAIIRAINMCRVFPAFCCAKSITVAIVAGPANKGIARGTKNGSSPLFSTVLSFSCGIVNCLKRSLDDKR